MDYPQKKKGIHRKGRKGRNGTGGSPLRTQRSQRMKEKHGKTWRQEVF